MKLSVIIVNYNVKYFLEQCLNSVLQAQIKCDEIYGENSSDIFVVDNNSKDASVDMLKQKFPKVKRIENTENLGFAVANNQAVKKTDAEFVLLLNPDTLVPEDTFVKILNFMDNTPDAGGLGVQMIDGNGKFLPESKRSFPTPIVSFYKIFGFSKLFPKSKKIGKYHLSYLNKNETHQVDVLSGAFMLLRSKTLEKAGLLDEDFFMYGEDIDLSYRIIKAGYKNYYFSDTTIIHYKGESTKKGSLNYVFLFYNAMIIFTKKHFSSKNIALFSLLIKTAVWLRAGLSVFKRIFNTLFLPVTDAALFFLGFYFLKPIWELYKFNIPNYYPEEYLGFAVPIYILIWLSAIFISNGYKKPADSKKLFRGILVGAFVILVFYSLLNEQYRYSRALLLLGTASALILSWSVRALFTILRLSKFGFQNQKPKSVLIFVDENNRQKVNEILNLYEQKTNNRDIFIFKNLPEFLSNTEIKEFILKNKISDVIFNINTYSVESIIYIMKKISVKSIGFKIINVNNSTIIGSHSINHGESMYDIDNYKITDKYNMKIKRIGDVCFSIIFLLFFPVLFLLVENKINFLKSIFKVLFGKLSWVGYSTELKKQQFEALPKIKKGVLAPVIYNISDPDETFKLNLMYAKNYNFTDDIYIIYKLFMYIGNKNF